MRRGALIGVFAALTACVAVPPDEGQPTRAQIATIEAKVALPPGAKPLDFYARYYSGEARDGRRIISGVYVESLPGRADRPGIYTVPAAEAPFILDGGCSVISVLIDADTLDVISAKCNGLA